MEVCEDFTDREVDGYPSDADAEDDPAKRISDFVSAAVRENAILQLNYFGE